MNICTIICRNYLASAKVLAKSFAESYPDGRCTVLVVDDIGGALRAQSTPSMHFITLAEIGVPDVDVMAGIYSPIEFSTAVKPWLLVWMLNRYGNASPVAYCDPDIRVYSQFEELEALLADHAVALTPHLTMPNPLDGHAPSEQAILLAGVYNLGFIGISESNTARAMLGWWQERLARDCVVNPPAGFFVDQRPMDFVPGLFGDVGILRHEGYNAAYWNMATRELLEGPEGLRINGEEVRFVHFSGYDPREPNVLSKHQDRVSFPEGSAWKRELDAYGAALLTAGYVEAMEVPYGLSRTTSGTKLSPLMRSLYRHASEEGFTESLFDETGELAFKAFLHARDSEWPGWFRYERLGWLADPSCRSAFPDPRGVDRASVGRHLLQGEIGRYLFPRVNTDDASRGGRSRVSRDGVVDGVNLVGYLNATLGVGEVGRQMVHALDALNMPVWPVSLQAPGSVNNVPFFTTGGASAMPFRCSLFCVNADMTPSVAQQFVDSIGHDGIRGGFWWWELDEFPEAFFGAFECVDFVIAGSRFVANAIARHSPVPVFTVPVPVGAQALPYLNENSSWCRRLQPPAKCTFLFSFDYRSVVKRKNPEAVISAYVDAFEGSEGTRLVVKSLNHDEFSDCHESLMRLARDRADIVFLQDVLSPADRDELVRRCDCYVSLHRSEGMGLTMAEAMYAGKPVIATAYSGNMDFMDPSNSLLVDYELVRVGDGAAPYAAESLWAEPDIGHASRLMRQVFEDPAAARRIGERAAESIRHTNSLAACSSALVAAVGGAWAQTERQL